MKEYFLTPFLLPLLYYSYSSSTGSILLLFLLLLYIYSPTPTFLLLLFFSLSSSPLLLLQMPGGREDEGRVYSPFYPPVLLRLHSYTPLILLPLLLLFYSPTPAMLLFLSFYSSISPLLLLHLSGIEDEGSPYTPFLPPLLLLCH